jgi:hypothetical protein
MARTRRKNPKDDMSGLITLAVVGVGAYLVYEWLQSNCASASPSFPSLCSLFPGTAAAATPAATATATAATPVPVTTATTAPISTAVTVSPAAPSQPVPVSQPAPPIACPDYLLAGCPAGQIIQNSIQNGCSVQQCVPAPASSTSTPWQLAIATMKAAAGTDSLNYNQWFWYFQNATAPVGAPSGFGVPNSISPQIAALTAQIGGDPTGATLISAEQFAQYLQQALQQSGMSGLAWARQPGIPASWINTYAFDGDGYV